MYGAHAFWVHPFFVWLAWCKLYGFTLDPRIMVACFVHDLGYIGKSTMDGEDGKQHPILGAKIMGWLFDDKYCRHCGVRYHEECSHNKWRNFCLYHSRDFSRLAGEEPSKLSAADKLATAITPAWLYIAMVKATGEYKEYMEGVVEGYRRGSRSISREWYKAAMANDVHKWFAHLKVCMSEYAYKAAAAAEERRGYTVKGLHG